MDTAAMEWRDQGAVLAVRRHGETAAIIEVFTAAHGRHAGVVRGGASRRFAPILQPGAQLDLTWRARLDDHLGHFTVEPLRSRSTILSDRLALAALNAVCALLIQALPERDAHPRLYHQTVALLDALEQGDWPLPYLRWEVRLLEEIGFGLDLSTCAVTGGTEDLAFVSPRTGRAVSRPAAGAWADRLLPLPACLTGGAVTAEGLAQGLHLTGFFLAQELTSAPGARPLPEARARLADLLARQV
jgi:DNA repair protein RecO (recombination protein O)